MMLISAWMSASMQLCSRIGERMQLQRGELIGVIAQQCCGLQR